MKKKIFKGLCLLAAVAVVFSVIIVTAVSYFTFSGSRRSTVRSIAGYVRETYDEGRPTAGLSNLADECRVTLVAPDGDVIYDSEADADAMENHAKREEIMEAKESGAGEAERTSDTLTTSTYYYAVELSDGNVLRLAVSYNSILFEILKSVPYMLVLAVISILLSMLLSSAIAKKIVNPIKKIDPDNPDDGEAYEELSVLLNKIKQQKTSLHSEAEALKDEQKKFSAITENMNEGLIVIDKDGGLLSVNRAALEIFGHRGEKADSVFVLNRSRAFIEAVETSLKGKSFTRAIENNGKIYQMVASPLKAGSESGGAVILLLDITEKAERERLRREFSANVSHELKTPLTAIKGSAEMLKSGMVKPEDTGRFIDIIGKESERLSSLLEDIIKLSGLDEGYTPPKREQIDLKELCLDTAKQLSAAAEQKSISINVSGEAKTESVRRLCNEIVYNLLENAIKYGKQGGRADVELSVRDGRAVISVKDDGIGISAEDKNRVFERFFRCDKSHSSDVPGTGLGLSIVKHAVESLGGTIELESTPGKGSIFTVTL